MTSRNSKIMIFLVSACLSASHLATAKGLEDLKPVEPAPSASSKGTAPSGEGANGSPSAPQSAPAATPPLNQPEASAASGQESEDEDVVQQVKPAPQPGSVHAKLINRLIFGASLGLTSEKPKSGTWSGGGAVNFYSMWRLNQDGQLFLTTSYVPMTGTWIYEKRSYDASVQGVFIGAAWQAPIFQRNLYTAKAELGYQHLSVRPHDDANVEATDLTSNKVAFRISGDYSWRFLEKLLFGPHVGLQFGYFTKIDFGVGTQLIF